MYMYQYAFMAMTCDGTAFACTLRTAICYWLNPLN